MVCWNLLCYILQRLLVVEIISRQLQRVWEDRLWGNIWVVVAGKGLWAESLHQNLHKNQSVAKRYFHKHFSLILSSNFRDQPFVAVSGNLGGKVPIVDDVLSSHEQELYPTSSLDENCIEFEFQTDRNLYVDSRQTHLVLKLKIVRGCCYETYKSREVKRSSRKKQKRTRKRRRKRRHQFLSLLM